MVAEKRKIRYFLPKKVLYSEGDIQNLNSLLREKDDQINVFEDDTFSIYGKGFIVLDFGNYCYKGFRHSLRHGWSVGPIAILFEYFK